MDKKRAWFVNRRDRYDNFSLKKLDPQTEDYARAIRIYEQGFEEKLRLPFEVISHLVNNTRAQGGMNSVLPYGFYDGGELIGFCLLTRYHEPRFTNVDYISLSPRARKTKTAAVFFNFVYEEITRLGDDFLLFEVERDESPDGLALERLYRAQGCLTLDCEHIMPVLNMTLERIPARVMTYPDPKTVGKDVYLTWLEAFLVDGYTSHVTPFLAPQDARLYARYIRGIYEDIKRSLPETISAR